MRRLWSNRLSEDQLLGQARLYWTMKEGDETKSLTPTPPAANPEVKLVEKKKVWLNMFPKNVATALQNDEKLAFHVEKLYARLKDLEDIVEDFIYKRDGIIVHEHGQVGRPVGYNRKAVDMEGEEEDEGSTEEMMEE